MSVGIALAERGLLPDALIRAGIRRLCAERLRDEAGAKRWGFLRSLSRGPIAPVSEMANVQHYEMPADFMSLSLGPRMKYSCCLYSAGGETLAEAEEAMLALTAERAELEDGQDVLELGCGWGSLSLWAAERFPASRITAVSNSAGQRAYIESAAAARGLRNLRVLTRDMNHFDPGGTYDRVVSVEMFEHMRNYAELMRRVAFWLRPGGALFVHVFCHRSLAYPFLEDGRDDWMARHFFTGGLMPAIELLPRFRGELELESRWRVDGRHYERTANHWLLSLDRRRREGLALLERIYGAQAPTRLRRWRIFFMACAELFGYGGGTEWGVAHYRFRRAA